MTVRRRDSALVRPYLVTDGRAVPSRSTLDLVTLVRATGGSSSDPLGAEKQTLLALCRAGALTVAEISAHLGLPVGICKVLIADLVDESLLATRAPIPRAERPDHDLGGSTPWTARPTVTTAICPTPCGRRSRSW